MATQFDIITQACIKLDGNAVSSFSDGTREVEVYQPLYDQLKKSELSGFRWNFNTFTEKLSLEVATPTDGRWTYQYLEPSNLLSLIDVFDSNGTPMDYLFEQGRIFANENEAFAKFQRNIDESDFPDYFVDLLVARLVVEGAEPLSGDTNVITRAEGRYELMMKRAKAIDTKQNPAQPIIRNQSRWLKAQYSSNRSVRFKPFGT